MPREASTEELLFLLLELLSELIVVLVSIEDLANEKGGPPSPDGPPPVSAIDYGIPETSTGIGSVKASLPLPIW